MRPSFQLDHHGSTARPHYPLALAVTTTACLLLGAGCTDDTGTEPEVQDTGSWDLLVRPDSYTFSALGDTLSLRVATTDEGSSFLPLDMPEWRSLSPAVVAVDSIGRVVSRDVGTGHIVASFENRADTVMIRAKPEPRAVDVARVPESLLFGDTIQLAASVLDRNGRTISNAQIEWSSSDTMVARIGANNLLYAVAVGSVTLSAAAEKAFARKPLAVRYPPVAAVDLSPDEAELPEGDTLVLDVTLRDDEGDAFEGPAVSWSSSDPEVATVEAGMVAAVSPGETRITAESGEHAAQAVVRIHEPGEGETRPPVAPSDPTATGTSPSEIEITWSDGSYNEHEFQVERMSSGGWTLVGSTPADATSFTDSGLAPETRYEYRIRACNAAGCGDTGSFFGTTQAAPPFPPANASATGISASEIEITWTDASDNEDEFRVQRKIDGIWALVGEVAPNATSFTDSGLAADTRYEYRIRACNTSGCGDTGSFFATTDPAPPPSGPVPAFPGAEGYGAMALSECDRSALRVVKVTSLEDSGPGTLRDAFALAEQRSGLLTVVTFDVAGYIDLDSRITFRRDCLYVAGQTAPGGGITIRNRGGQSIVLRADVRDVVIRHLRLRAGFSSDHRGNVNVLLLGGHDIILDHLSSGWTTDKLVSIRQHDWTPSDEVVHRVSVQRSLLHETFAAHSTAMQITYDRTLSWDQARIGQITLHHNLFAHNGRRNPAVGVKDFYFLNNVVYNWHDAASQLGGRADLINNYYKTGPMTDSRFDYELVADCERRRNPWSFYAAGNLGPHNDDPNADNWVGTSRMVACYYQTGSEPGAPLPDYEQYRRNTPLQAPPVPVSLQPASDAYRSVLNDVGARWKLACDGRRVSARDAVDQRLVDEVQNGTGVSQEVPTENDVGGFPAITRGTPCSDSDGDALPDQWESRFFRTPTAADPRADSDGDGYTNLEEFLNFTVPR